MTPELEERFSRVYAAVGATFSRDVARHVEIQANRAMPGAPPSISFKGGRSREELVNEAFALIASIANLKDHLRRFANTRGRDPDDVDAATRGSTDLCVLIDLNNAEKHGEGPCPKRGVASGLARRSDTSHANDWRRSPAAVHRRV